MSNESHGQGRPPADAERRYVSAVRRALVPSLSLPIALASIAASATGAGLPFSFVGPAAALALAASIATWLRVVVLWRRLPDPEDDEDGWRRWRGAPGPRDLGPGGGGLEIDWTSFERDFWAHVAQSEQARVGGLVPSGV